MTHPSVLHIDYEIYCPANETTTIVRESEVGPGDTEIVQREKFPDKYEVRLVVRDDDIPLLIEALQRRYNDVKDATVGKQLITG